MPSNWIVTPGRVPSTGHAARARERQATLTKPAGSLGRLEQLAIDLAGLQHNDCPSASRAEIIVFAGDHGIAAKGVSAFRAEVTVQMLHNFASGGAAISVLARELGARLSLVDAGTLGHQPISGVVVDKPRRGSRDFSTEPAMTGDELDFALGAGARAIERAAAGGAEIVLLGEMGIANTTSAAAVAAALMGRRASELVGRGTGIDDAGLARKAALIGEALQRHDLTAPQATARDILAAVGGFEIAALAGAIIAAAQRGLPILIDGFIVSVAALAAVRINPSCRPYLLFSHASAERGHSIVLVALDARPLLDLDLRLGEASGSALALPLLRLACALHNDMATFEDAAVAGRTAP